MRPYRSHGPNGPGVYPQCVPGDGGLPHLLSWEDARREPEPPSDLGLLSPSELEVLQDAADGLSTAETAVKRQKGSETVKTQRRAILLKLGARNMAHAVGMMLDSSHGDERGVA